MVKGADIPARKVGERGRGRRRRRKTDRPAIRETQFYRLTWTGTLPARPQFVQSRFGPTLRTESVARVAGVTKPRRAPPARADGPSRASRTTDQNSPGDKSAPASRANAALAESN